MDWWQVGISAWDGDGSREEIGQGGRRREERSRKAKVMAGTEMVKRWYVRRWMDGQIDSYLDGSGGEMAKN